MPYLEKLREGRDNAPVAFHEFALYANSGKSGLFLFFEGKDIPYYLPRIKAHYGGDFHKIVCKGKSKVIAVYDLINSHTEYNIYKKAFFIDRDFNTPLSSNKRIYETPCYSIENLYISEKSFKEILKSEFNIPEVHQSKTTIDEIVKIYCERQREFHDHVSLFNAWYACLIETREKTGNENPVRLDDKLPGSFVNITLYEVTKHYDLDSINRLYPQAVTEVSEENIANKLQCFKSKNVQLLFRGKYEMEFLLSFIELLIDDSLTSQQIIKEKIKFNFSKQISIEQALNIFSVYAETPEGLVNYIKNVVS